jgi:hypothetical protein
MPEELIVDRRPDGIAVLTLNDPERRNAMSDEMTSAWKQSALPAVFMAAPAARRRAGLDAPSSLVTQSLCPWPRLGAAPGGP